MAALNNYNNYLSTAKESVNSHSQRLFISIVVAKSLNIVIGVCFYKTLAHTHTQRRDNTKGTRFSYYDSSVLLLLQLLYSVVF